LASLIFAEVYLDEDVSVLVSDLLRSRGFNSVTTRDAGKLGQSDSDQLEYAVSQRMALLTHNRADFEDLRQQYIVQERTHWGIIVASRRYPRQIVGNLLKLLNRLTADELQDQLLYV
jgi:predicted nuclease of predicted toxin-antitoxin system